MLFTVVEMPLSLGFGDDAVNRGPVMPGVLCALDMLFIADVALNCVTGVQDGPEIVMQQPRILARYLKGWCAMDVISSVPLATLAALSFDVGALRTLRLLKVFKLARLAKVTRVGEVTRNLVDSGFVNQAFVSLVALLVLFGAVQHWLACLYWAVARRTENDWGKDEAKARGFAPAPDLADEPLGARLVFAYHWAVYATYAAVPNTMGTLRLKPAQSLYCVFCALVGMLFMSVLIGEVASILDDIRIEDHDKQAALKSIDEFMNHHNIAYELRARIRLHYIFLYNNKHTRRFDDIFAVLPAELKSKLSVGVRVPYLRRTSCFVDLRPTCVSAVASAMVTTHYAPMDLVFSQSEDADGVRCIADGNVFHFIRGLPWPKVIAATKVDDTFGEECVLLMKSRMFVSSGAGVTLYKSITAHIIGLRHHGARPLRDLLPAGLRGRRAGPPVPDVQPVGLRVRGAQARRAAARAHAPHPRAAAPRLRRALEAAARARAAARLLPAGVAVHARHGVLHLQAGAPALRPRRAPRHGGAEAAREARAAREHRRALTDTHVHAYTRGLSRSI